MTFPDRIQRLIDDRRLEAAAFDDRAVIALWTRALKSWRDAGVSGLSDEGAFALAYDAGRQAATAVLAAAGLRVRGQGHHYIVFYTLAALDEVVSAFGVDLETMREARHLAVYEASVDAAALRKDREKLEDIIKRFLAAGHAWLGAKRPGLAKRLPSP